MTDPAESPQEEALALLKREYDRALAQSGLPHRSPSHRMAAQLVAAAQAAAYARAIAIVGADPHWKSRAAELAHYVDGRERIDQSDIDSAERAESTLRRYGLHGLR
jgi:hypothetical protein